jgi:hypothetical protein
MSVLLRAQKMIVLIGPVSVDRISSEMPRSDEANLRHLIGLRPYIDSNIKHNFRRYSVGHSNDKAINFSLAIKTDTANDRLSASVYISQF